MHYVCSSLQSHLLPLIGRDSSNKHRGAVVTWAWHGFKEAVTEDCTAWSWPLISSWVLAWSLPHIRLKVEPLSGRPITSQQFKKNRARQVIWGSYRQTHAVWDTQKVNSWRKGRTSALTPKGHKDVIGINLLCIVWSCSLLKALSLKSALWH